MTATQKITSWSRCHVTQVITTANLSQHVVLFAVQPPNMVIPLMNKTVRPASSVELRCIASGHPFPSYSWTRDGSSVIRNGVLSQENTVLRISAVNWQDEGLYTCSATNSFGSVSSSAYLAVHCKSMKMLVL